MKRTIPLIITAVVGFVMIVSFFIPATMNWGELAAIFFDILAAIAFVLGGGNLLKVHLKKISDRQAGWGYSGVTIVAFLATLFVGLVKFSSPPAVDQEYYGETFAALPVASFPESQITRANGALPKKANGEKLPFSARNQMFEDNGQIVFRGWMLPNQKQDLMGFKEQLEWQCQVEQLFEQAQPPTLLQGKIFYYADPSVLSFKGSMQEDERDELLKMSDDQVWRQAVAHLFNQSRVVTRVSIDSVPSAFKIPDNAKDVVSYDEEQHALVLHGPMSVSQRNNLADQFLRSKPLTDAQRKAFLDQIEDLGDTFTEPQTKVFNRILDNAWTVEQLRLDLQAAGKAEEVDKTACEMLDEMKSGVKVINPKKKSGVDVSLNDEQAGLLEIFATDSAMTPAQLVDQLKAAGEFNGRQQAALDGFLAKSKTVAERKKALGIELLKLGPPNDGQHGLNQKQQDFLFQEYREQVAWRGKVDELFRTAQVTKYPWSGGYRAMGKPFWWLYEYAFKPLTATMFAILAFYVASAAFRAFRAKNIDASLLLGTAFIILLGRTFAGVLLTDWLPPELEGLKITNLSVYIMQVFTTTGNRAIMIGIALGIASTSLKVLLGIDRSYLGSSDE